MKEMRNICEWCGDRTGDFNSRFLNVDDEGLGDWICLPCEEQLEEEYWEAAKYTRADMSNVKGVPPNAQGGAI